MTLTLVSVGIAVLTSAARAQSSPRRPLAAGDVDDIAKLEMLEDRREFDAAELARILGSAHPEVRRRAALAIGRIADARGRAIVRGVALDADTAVAATEVFAIGQLRDTGSVAWLDSLMSDARTPPTVATEAAAALGKIRTAETRASLARFLERAPADARAAPVVREALLSIGRSTTRGDIAPIVRWAASPDVETRWRAAWALFRPRDPASVQHLLRLSDDASGEVRDWAVRGLTAPQADSAGLGARASARLRAATRDTDRRVRTEAVRALGTYADSATRTVLVRALDDADTWISVSAAEALGRPEARATPAVRELVAATAAGKPSALRVTALQSLLAISAAAAAAPAASLARDTAAICRSAAVQVFARLGADGRAGLDALVDDADARVKLEARRARSALDDTTTRRAGQGQPRRALVRPIDTGRSLEDYRRIVERWVVPDYQGAPRPRARWDTPRGSIEVELYPGDAPLATEDFVRTMESGAIVGVEFGRVVPDFVDQQRPIRDDGAPLRDEVNRRRLVRGNLSWATAGLDTGRPGYTLGNTPQPHNEGDFTSLGRVVRGMDVVDRIELGDRVTGARMLVKSR